MVGASLLCAKGGGFLRSKSRRDCDENGTLKCRPADGDNPPVTAKAVTAPLLKGALRLPADTESCLIFHLIRHDLRSFHLPLKGKACEVAAFSSCQVENYFEGEDL